MKGKLLIHFNIAMVIGLTTNISLVARNSSLLAMPAHIHILVTTNGFCLEYRTVFRITVHTWGR